MGDSISRLKPDDLSWDLLIHEIRMLNQDELSESEALPKVFDAEDPETGLTLYRRCPKKADHDEFIDVKSLTVDKLPIGAQCQYGLDSVKHEASHTVKLTTSYTSKKRPDLNFWSYQLKDSDTPRVGTGYVIQKLSDNLFEIETAAHQCFDKEEINKTVVEFFHDTDDKKRNTITGEGVDIVKVSVKDDRCQFTCRLKNTTELQKVVEGLLPEAEGPPPAGFDLSFLVSHPHGTCKKVSFGEVIEEISFDPTFLNSTLHLVHFFIEKRGLEVIEAEHKRVVYFLVKEYFVKSIKHMKGEELPITTFEEDILTHLQSKEIVNKSCDMQYHNFNYLKTEWEKNLMQYLEIKSISLSNRKEAQEALAEYHAIEAQKLHKKLPEEWRDRLTKAFHEMWARANELSLGGKNAKPCSKVRYSMATCGGSSGAKFHRIVRKEKDDYVRFYFGTHSAGKAVKDSRNAKNAKNAKKGIINRSGLAMMYDQQVDVPQS